MKKLYIVHGWDDNPENLMFKWIKDKLEEKNFSVVIPEMPNPEKPEIEAWVNKLNEVVDVNEDIYFVGHSIGCQAVLRYLERLGERIKAKGIIFIAPWMHLDEKTIEEGDEEIVRPWIETPIDWEKVKSYIENQVVCLFSDDDPYVPLSETDLFKEKLNAKIIIEKNKGHFDRANNITENPTVVSELLKFKK